MCATPDKEPDFRPDDGFVQHATLTEIPTFLGMTMQG